MGGGEVCFGVTLTMRNVFRGGVLTSEDVEGVDRIGVVWSWPLLSAL